MEGTGVKERALALEGGTPPVRPSRGTQTSDVSHHHSVRSTSLPDKTSFAEAGARRSFQNRTENSLQASSAGKLVASSFVSPSQPLGQRNSTNRAIKPNSNALDLASTLDRPSPLTPSTDASGALKAAAMAASAHSRPAASRPVSVSRSSSSKHSFVRSEHKAAPNLQLSQNGSTVGAGLAAAKASVSKPEPQEAKAFNLHASTCAALQQMARGSTTTKGAPDRVTAAASAAMIQSREASKTANPVAAEVEPNPSPSKIAALSVSNQTQSSPSIQLVNRDAKFGVILTRSASPSVDVAPTASQRPSSTKRFQSLYQLPSATVSEPSLLKVSLENGSSVSSTRVVSPLVRLPVRPTLGDRNSSSGASLADSGAATAMASRSSSAASLPTLSQCEDMDALDSNLLAPLRSRPVHLKATMRKARRHEKENKKHSHAESQCLSEAQRKRYEGVWASNHGPSPFASPDDDESDFLDGLVVRELWIRSKLSLDSLAHVWTLVDQGNKGRLKREEFAVGMWLIDQCLSGRKLPATSISIEVWRSAQRLTTFLRH